MDLSTLISRLTQAEEGSRELDAEIALAMGVKPSITLGDGVITEQRHVPRNPPHYTTSLDAALTLVPEGWAWKVGTCCVSDDAWVVPDFNHPVHGERLRKQFGDIEAGSIWDTGIDVDKRPSGSPALALCIAALKARA